MKFELLDPWVGLVLAYLVGSFPSAYLAGKMKGVDLRTVGSGNLGATNVMRTLGWRWGLPVYIVDVAKGFIPVALFPWLIETQHSELWAITYGGAALAGHANPIFLLFRGGGKGVATASGVFLALAPWAALLSTIVFVIGVRVTNYVSVGSILAASLLPAAVAVTAGVRTPVFAASFAVTALVWWTHRANIGRLRRGEEPGLRKPKPAIPGRVA